MIKILEFIFQDFWHWSGTLIFLCVAISPLIVYDEPPVSDKK